MDKAGRLEIFVKVADLGSLAAAARLLGLTPSAVSRALAELERHLDVALLHRSTRRLLLTADGISVLAQARSILTGLSDLEASVARAKQRVAGSLRVGLPVPIGRHVIWPRMHAFLERYPEVQIHCVPVQDPGAMLDGNFDVMIVTGKLPASRLVARPLGFGRTGIYAAPEYLRKYGEPRTPEELANHRCLIFHAPWMQKPADEWGFARQGAIQSVRVHARLVAEDREGLIVAALGGAGIVRMACFDPGLIAEGKLRRLLPEWESIDGLAIHALYRKGASAIPRVGAFLAFIQACFAGFDPDQITVTRP